LGFIVSDHFHGHRLALERGILERYQVGSKRSDLLGPDCALNRAALIHSEALGEALPPRPH
jgi:hypothetical protein